jgi:hypothetical protein
MNIRQIDDLEKALKVTSDVWPCRSDFNLFEPLRGRWRKLAAASGKDDVVRGLKDVQRFVEVDSWLEFRYGDLNRALRHLRWLAEIHPTLDAEHKIWCQYLIGATHVRLAQYLLAICRDVTAVVPTDLKEYLLRRLTYGDQDAEYIAGVVEGTVSWVERSLARKGIELPSDIDPRRLMTPPPYAEEFVDLIRFLTDSATESIYLVVAAEVQEFDDIPRLRGYPRLVSAAQAGDKVAALVTGFLIRAFGVPKELLSGCASHIRAASTSARSTRAKPPAKARVSQKALELSAGTEVVGDPT